MTLATAGNRTDIVYEPWATFTARFRREWRPGQHITCVAPSGEGKTTLFHGLLGLRRYVVALDVKGGDETLAALGWERLPIWPGKKAFLRKIRDNDEHGRPSRYIVGLANIDSADAMRRQVASLAQALNDLYELGKVTLYVDELQVACDRRMMNLAGICARCLVSARSRGLSFLASAQGDSWIIGEAKSQPSYLAIGHTMNRTMQTDLARLIGRSLAAVRGLIGALPEHTWAIAERSPRRPIVITDPPYVAPVTPKAA